MPYTVTEQLLLLVADYVDLKRRLFSWRNIGVVSDAPWLHRHRRLCEEHIRNQRKMKQHYTIIARLRRGGYLARKAVRQSTGYLLTPKGELRVLYLKLRSTRQRKLPYRQWLMVFFDVPEHLRPKRDLLRRSLAAAGFVPWQLSIWATRYDVEREIQELVQRNGLQRYVKALRVQASRERR